jgi:hypothetical protein
MEFKPQQPPALKHDAMMLERFKQEVSANGRLERRIAWNLLMWLEQNGFRLVSLWDGEEWTELNSAKEAMELMFNLDEAHLYVKKPTTGQHRIYFVFGNGTDIIADHTYAEGDPDSFMKVMDDFDVEFVASIETVENCLSTEIDKLCASIIEKADHGIAMADVTSCMDMLRQIRELCNR